MEFFDPIRRQLRSVIEWPDPGEDDLIRQWSDNGDEIKNASKLIVGPGQGCLFVYEGRVRSVITRPGLYDLETDNIPFVTTLKKALQFFESEHKTGVFYFKTSRILNQKWGTLSPIKYLDPEFGFPISLKAFGNFGFQITEPGLLFTTVTGMRDIFTVTDLRTVLASRLAQILAAYLAGQKLSYIHIDAKREEIAAAALALLAPDFATLGILVHDFRIEGSDFDEETHQRIGQISDKLADNHAASRLGLTYGELQKLESMRDAARNEGNGAGMVVGLGAGAGLARDMAAPAGAAGSGESVESRMRNLKKLFDGNLISVGEFAAKRAEILRDI